MLKCASYFRRINPSYSNCRVCKSFAGLHKILFSTYFQNLFARNVRIFNNFVFRPVSLARTCWTGRWAWLGTSSSPATCTMWSMCSSCAASPPATSFTPSRDAVNNFLCLDGDRAGHGLINYKAESNPKMSSSLVFNRVYRLVRPLSLTSAPLTFSLIHLLPPPPLPCVNKYRGMYLYSV